MVKKFIGWLVFLIASVSLVVFTWNIISLWILIPVGVILYLNLGNCLGKLCLKARKEYSCGDNLYDFLWPFDSSEALIENSLEEMYLIGMTICGWWVKMFHILACLVLGLFIYTIMQIGPPIFRFITFPSSRLCRCKEAKEEC
jgi:hypothetical protein